MASTDRSNAADLNLLFAYIANGPDAVIKAAAEAQQPVSEVAQYLAGAAELLALQGKKRQKPADDNPDGGSKAPGSSGAEGTREGEEEDLDDMDLKRLRLGSGHYAGRGRGGRGAGASSSQAAVLHRTVQLLLEDDPAVERACQLIVKHRFSHEHVGDSQLLGHPRIWRTLLDSGGLPMTALLRNLGRLSATGAIVGREQAVAARLGSEAAVHAARLHPIVLLEALRVYGSGHGEKGSLAWVPSRTVLDALEAAFYLSFKNVEPTGLRYLLGVDVSGSMDGAKACGMTSLSAREAAAAMLMALLRTEDPPGSGGRGSGAAGRDAVGSSASIGAGRHRRVTPMAFSSGFQALRVDAGMRLDEVAQVMRGLDFDSTDCAQPMLYALRKRIPVDVFVIMTDNETYAGSVRRRGVLAEVVPLTPL